MEPGRGHGGAAVLVAFAAVVGAVWLVAILGPFAPVESPERSERPTPTEPPGGIDLEASSRVGFVGLPPERAAPSTPRRGELVLEYFGRQFTHWYEVWLYEDGRLIWQREGDLREGANEYSTGLLEQRLTPQGVELLRRRGSAADALFGFPWQPPYPASWLPPGAWADRTIRAFVPSRYAVCYQGLLRRIEPSRILAWLPATARRLLRPADFDVGSVQGWLAGFGGGCSSVATDDARAAAGALAESGFRQDEEFGKHYALTFYLEPGGEIRNEIAIRFQPVLPHGEAGCGSCSL